MIPLEICQIHILKGPNIWGNFPVFEAWVNLGNLKDSPSNSVPGFCERIKRWFPTMIEHRCSIGAYGGFFQRLDLGTWPGHILEHVTIELQNLVGHKVGFGKAVDTSIDGVYKIVFEYLDESVAESCFREAREILLAAYTGNEYDINQAIIRLQAVADRNALGPSTKSIVDAAASRHIPWRRLQKGCSLIQFGQGIYQRRIWTAETDRTGAIAEYIVQDKQLTRNFLQSAGIPVAKGCIVASLEDAWKAAEEIGIPVVVKPRDANHGRGVFTNLTTRKMVENSYMHAEKEGSGVMVEEYIQGFEHRILIIGGKLIAANRGDPAVVTGDGIANVRELIESQLNSTPLRGSSETSPWSKIDTLNLNALILCELERQGCQPDSIPNKDEQVLISNFSHKMVNVTEQVHARNRDHLLNAAKVVDLDICGIDLVCKDISIPFEEQKGAIVELNASPSLLLHLKPTVEKETDVGKAVIELIYPEGKNFRIPIFGVAGSSGKTATVHLISHLLRCTEKFIASSTNDGLQFGDRFTKRKHGDRIEGPQGALLYPRTEIAVCEISPEMILIDGLGFDRCNIAVVLNVFATDFGIGDIDSMDQLAKVHRCIVDVVLSDGTAILNADDAHVASMAQHCRGNVLYFSQNPSNPIIQEHRKNNGKAVFITNGTIYLAEGADERTLCHLSEAASVLPVENVLGAIGAVNAYGLSDTQILDGFKHFQISK